MKTGILLTCLGVALFAGLSLLVFVLDKSNWPTVDGVISEVYVQEKRQQRVGTVFSVKVKYIYEVEGKNFKGKRISWMDFDYPNRASAAKNAPYHVDHPVKVYYNPKAPEKSFLKPRVSLGFHLFAWPSIFVFAGVMFIVRSVITKPTSP